jgi:hypothetical protein
MVKLILDDKLVFEVKKINQKSTETAAVTAALEEYIQRHKQLKIKELFGAVDYDTYDYKQQRNKKAC